MTPNSWKKLVSFGRLFFAIALLAWGAQHLVAGNFVTRVVPWWPAWIPGRTLWAYLVGAAMIAAGAAIIVRVQARAAALAFSALAFASFALLHLPLVLKGALLGGAWTAAGKALVMCGGAICIAVSLDDEERHVADRLFASEPTRSALIMWGRVCLGAFMILGGIQHFKFDQFVATLVPAWIPGALFWTYFAAVALIAGGTGIIVSRVTRLASVLSGAMIFSWVFLVHIPRALHDPHNAGEVAAVFEALAFSGVAFLLAGLAYGRGATNERPVPAARA